MVKEFKFPERPTPPEDNSLNGEEETEVIDIFRKKKMIESRRDGLGVPDADRVEIKKMFMSLKLLVAQIPEVRKRRLLADYSVSVKEYLDDELLGWIIESKEKAWTERPLFFWALANEALRRNLL